MATLDELVVEQVRRMQAERSPESATAEPAEPSPEFSPERVAETAPEHAAESAPASAETPPADLPPAPPPAAARAAAAPPKDPLLQSIESAMQEGLEDLYRQLPPERRTVFRTRGEQVAAQIRTLLSSAKVKAKNIFRLLVDWLKMLPGTSRFYLEQEAKIKTDKILLAAEEERRRGAAV